MPTCDTCQKPTAFVVQLETSDVSANFGNIGVGYAFVCLDHEASSASACKRGGQALLKAAR